MELLACQWLPIFVGQKAAFKAVHNLKARVVNSLGCHRADSKGAQRADCNDSDSSERTLTVPLSVPLVNPIADSESARVSKRSA